MSSIEKLKALGWAPRKDLERIMSDYVEWLEGSGLLEQFYQPADHEMELAGVVRAAEQAS